MGAADAPRATTHHDDVLAPRLGLGEVAAALDHARLDEPRDGLCELRLLLLGVGEAGGLLALEQVRAVGELDVGELSRG